VDGAMTADRPGRFATTRWSLVVAAGETSSEETRTALAEWCEIYWYPVYAFARRSGLNADEAADSTQGFFAELLEKNYLGQAEQSRGRFRTFLLTAYRHHAAKQREKGAALKRGGGTVTLCLDYDDGERRYVIEPADGMTPERLYERGWAVALLGRVLELLREDYRSSGKSSLFEALCPILVDGGAARSYRELGQALEMSEAAVKVAAHRLRRRYAGRLRSEIATTVTSEREVDDEIRSLLQAIG